MSRLRAALVLVGGGFALFGACQTPTSITFVLRTDVDCSQTTPARSLAHVVFGEPKTVEAPDSLEQPSSTKECAVTSGRLAEIGTLVALPREDEDAQLAMIAVLGVERPTGDCGRVPDADGDPWGGCIVSRRRLGFIEGEALEVDVPLYFSCVGVPCDAFSTCVPERGCVDSKVDPNECIDARCGDGGLDGGTSSGVASSSGASSDASSSDASASVSASDASSREVSSGASSAGGEGGMSQGGGGSSSSDGGGGSSSSGGGGGSSSSGGGAGSSSSGGGGGSSSSGGGAGSSSSGGGAGSSSSGGGGGSSSSGGASGPQGGGGIVEGAAGGIAVETP